MRIRTAVRSENGSFLSTHLCTPPTVPELAHFGELVGFDSSFRTNWSFHPLQYKFLAAELGIWQFDVRFSILIALQIMTVTNMAKWDISHFCTLQHFTYQRGRGQQSIRDGRDVNACGGGMGVVKTGSAAGRNLVATAQEFFYGLLRKSRRHVLNTQQRYWIGEGNWRSKGTILSYIMDRGASRHMFNDC